MRRRCLRHHQVGKSFNSHRGLVSDLVDGATRAGYVFICTKPQDTAVLIDEIRDDLRPDAVVVSFVSGLTTQWFAA